ncbi:uncharacterized protein LOC119603668 [Lucilia sericata]|uniref:uncharacterized protein LOC119603668 n=1 Tax=Lucilia sericata TaxID=13632 RepID=UPI0018A7EB87|nr:uncharacterized protein LOC119603668 [Lucilia sericata]
MYFLRNPVMGIITCDTHKLTFLRRSLRYIKCNKLLFGVLLTVAINISLAQQDHNRKLHSYGGRFVGEEEAEAIAIEANMRLAKIPCNFTTKTNCIYAEQQLDSLTLPIKDLRQRNSQHNINEIVVSWVSQAGIINRTEHTLGVVHSYDNRNANTITNTTDPNNVRGKAQNGFYNFNWIFELLACMMLASAFEICLLVLRNLRNISLAFFGFWSALNARFQKLCYACPSTSSGTKSDQQRKRNVAMGEKRTLSYIFAILTWRASQTAKGGTTSTEANLRDENTGAISYGHVTTMGDLLLLILFTHVYYQRQKFHQGSNNDNVNAESEELLEGHKERENDNNGPVHQEFYDKQNEKINNSTFSDQTHNRRGLSKRCSHYCGNMYQQILLLQEYHKSAQVKIAPLTSSYATKIPYLTYCTGIVWHTCCFCQYSCRTCCYCCSSCRCCRNQRCYIYVPPLCNTIYCCCFYKSLKSFHDVNFQYCCYLCCWPDFYHISAVGSHSSRCCCHFYCERVFNHCCLCNALVNKASSARALLLLNKIKSYSSNAYRPSPDYCVWKVKYNNQSYSLFYEIDGQSYSFLYLIDGRSMFVCKRNYYQIALDVFCSLLPQYFVTIKNCQSFVKWKKFHVAVVVMALIVICASSAGANYDHHHYYNSLFNKCHKHFSRCKQNRRKRRRRRRRHQHCKAYRPQHYFYTTLIQCVKRQNAKKLHKKFATRLHKKSAKLLTPNIYITCEYSLATGTATTPVTTKHPIVRAIKRVRGSKPNIVWLLIGLIWFEGPKIVNCNVIINYQNQQQHEQQQQQHQQTGNSHKETTTNSVNSNFEYKMDNFNQMKTKSGNNNNNNNSNNNSNNNGNKNKNKNNNNNNNNSNTNNSNRSSTSSSNIHLSVNVIPIINTIHFKHYCNNNYHQKLIRSSQRVQRALKTNPNLDTSITSSASLNYNNINDDLDSEQMPSSSAFQTFNEESHAQSDLMRLESIKHQILFKLGLTRKPNVSHPLPKQFIWDTIYRADGINSFHEFSNTNNFQDHRHIMPQQNYPFWSAKPNKGANDDRKDRSKDSEDLEDGVDNIKRSLENNIVLHKKYGKNKQQLQQQQQQHQTLPKLYNNDINYQKGATSKNLNQLLYTTNRNKLNHTNKTVNNFTILKQTKHQQQFHKNSQHSTTAKKTTIIHQQNRRQYEPLNQYTNSNKNNIQNNNKNNNRNNNNNNDNNVNNSNNHNNNNNIIMVQKHLRNNNKYIEEAKKFTYLTDINSRDDSLNSMEYHNPDIDDNNRVVRKQKQHKELLQHNVPNVETSESSYHHHFYIDTHDDSDKGNVHVDDIVAHANPSTIHEGGNDVVHDDDGDGDRYHHHSHQHRHENYFPKLDAFDENDDFFGSTQEIITFAEKGKMYKNHRLVEFSHQNNEKPKQKLHVRNAEIHIRIDKISIKNKSRAGSGIKRKRLKIWIFQLIENNYTYKGFDHVAKFCASFEVDTSRLGWKKFDITTTVKEWYSRRESEKLRLLIDCTGCGKVYTVHLFNDNTAKADASIRERRIADERRNANINKMHSKHFYNITHNYENYTNFQYNQTILVADKDGIRQRNPANSDEKDLLNSSRPFLVLHTEARRQRRVRRRAINCNGALHGQCCKESFYVSFKALGWDDWIIAPRGYFANYCRGDCTGPYRTPDTFQTFHAHFIEEYRKMGLLNGMQPCCAPIKFSSMSLIYYGDEGIIKRDLPKMVVDECGCP